MVESNKSSIIPVLLVAIVIAVISRFLKELFVIGGSNPVSDVIIAILLGMFINATVDIPSALKPGINFCLKKVLKMAIILLGLGLSFAAVISTGAKALVIILICVAIALTLTQYLGRRLGLNDKLATLIGVGTSICGATAIVATAPAINADDADVSYSVATITFFGIIAIVIYPVIGSLLQMSDMQFGTWAGTAINETSQVVAAGFIYSDAAGKIATVVKLTRTVLLAPLVVLLGFIYARKQSEASGGSQEVNVLKIFPWFVVGFLALALVRTIGDNIFGNIEMWRLLLTYAKITAKFLIVMAMASVGLMTNFQKMKTMGLRPFLGGLFAASIMGVVSIALIYLLNFA